MGRAGQLPRPPAQVRKAISEITCGNWQANVGIPSMNWKRRIVTLSQWATLSVALLLLPTMAIGQSGQDVRQRCAQLTKESGQYSRWNTDGGWEFRRKWERLTANLSVEIVRLATFKMDWETREMPSELPKLKITCSGGEASVELIFERWATVRPDKVEVVLSWDGEAPNLETDWIGINQSIWPGHLGGSTPRDKALQTELAKKLFNSSRLDVCTSDRSGVMMTEHFDLDGMKERGVEVLQMCDLNRQ